MYPENGVGYSGYTTGDLETIGANIVKGLRFIADWWENAFRSCIRHLVLLATFFLPKVTEEAEQHTVVRPSRGLETYFIGDNEEEPEEDDDADEEAEQHTVVRPSRGLESYFIGDDEEESQEEADADEDLKAVSAIVRSAVYTKVATQAKVWAEERDRLAAIDEAKKGNGNGKKGKGKGGPPPKGKGKGDASAQKGAPLKTDVVPTTEMKKLFWKPVRLNDTTKKEPTVWERIHQAGAIFDAKELESLFANAAPARPLAPKKTTRRVFTQERTLQIEVMMASLPTWGALEDAIQRMDDTKLSAHSLQVLVSALPTEEETEKLASLESGSLGVAEDFMIRLIRVPYFRLRLQAWNFLRSFDSDYECLRMRKARMAKALDTLRRSNRIQRLLAMALHVGNYLNGGTSRACADGFDIDYLPKLAAVKALDGIGENSFNLLDYIVKQIERESPGMLSEIFDKDMEKQSLHAVRKDKLSDVLAEVAERLVEVNVLTRSWREAKFIDKPSRTVETTLDQRSVQLRELQEELAIVQSNYMQVCSWFQMDTEQAKPTEEFFSTWDNFLDNVGASLAKVAGPPPGSQPRSVLSRSSVLRPSTSRPLLRKRR